MTQLNIYYEIGFSDDPIYNELSNLTVENVVTFNNIEVRKNKRGWFEVSSQEVHDCYQELDKCYEEVNRLICPQQRAFI